MSETVAVRVSSDIFMIMIEAQKPGDRSLRAVVDRLVLAGLVSEGLVTEGQASSVLGKNTTKTYAAAKKPVVPTHTEQVTLTQDKTGKVTREVAPKLGGQNWWEMGD